MISTLENPIKFFEDYFEHLVHQDLKTFNIEKLEVLNNSHVDIIDEKNHLIKVLNSENEYDIYSFENFIKRRLEEEFQKSKILIEKRVHSFIDSKLELTSYLNIQQSKVSWLINHKSAKKFRILSRFALRLEGEIHKFNNLLSNEELFYSFNFIDTNKIFKIETLYSQLINSPKLIECSKETFNNAFLGRKLIKEKIKWLVTGKNGYTSKISLFYFVEELINHSFLDKKILQDLSKYIAYVFVDKNGKSFDNLKVSKSSSSTNPSRKQDIDSIIDELKKIP